MMPKILPLSGSPATSQPSSLRLPANKRVKTPVSDRLDSITDPEATTSRIAKPSGSTIGSATPGQGEAPSPTPRRRSLASIRLPLPLPRRESGSSKISHPAPPYDWVPEPIEEGDGRVPIEGEKLRQLRNDDDEGKTVLWWRRKRVVLLTVVLLIVVAMAIGLGVGLAHTGGKNTKAAGAGNRTEARLEFPLGQWTVGAILADATPGCTSNPDLWRCYPYVVGGETSFDLTILNTTALYAPNSTAGDSEGAGVPANLTISSSNPFAIPFTNQSLTYTSSTSDDSARRLEWSFEMTKSVMPSSSVMAGGEASQCAFPGTMLTGTLYLDRPRARSEGMGSDREWPYATEIRQRQERGGGAVVCQGMRGGTISVPAADGPCECVYRNY